MACARNAQALGPGGAGALAGTRIAVKDLIAVAGQRIGAGVPAWLQRAAVESENASALQRLLDAGAELTGIAQTDELAFSLSGTNEHYGTPRNHAAPGRVPGGSTSGPAAAVAAGTADLGLGTDTAGSLRVPGSYCGLYAWRPTHDVVPVTGVLPLAQSFDSVGLLARGGATLAAAAGAMLPEGSTGRAPRALLRSQTLMDLATPETARALDAALTALAVSTGLPVVPLEVETLAPEEWTAAFRTIQAAQAWQDHGEFVEAHPGGVSAAVADQFRSGASVSAGALSQALRRVERTSRWLDDELQGGWLCLPSTSTPALSASASQSEVEAARTGTLKLTTLASRTGHGSSRVRPRLGADRGPFVLKWVGAAACQAMRQSDERRPGSSVSAAAHRG